MICDIDISVSTQCLSYRRIKSNDSSTCSRGLLDIVVHTEMNYGG